MTYSQRLSDGANSSDIIYLEYQIGTTKEELRIALEKQETWERELAHLKSSPIRNASEDGSEEKALMEKVNDTKTQIRTLSEQLEQLQEAMGKLGD
ncbi:hypothetical protein QVE09_01015 [Paenibacillus sp. ClWae2A]|uniref:hypothetical protein n=1 Tax=Paenibacillus sp. ClWae2A TaxID=3057177 RepID=UPI0028F5DAC5|nr:hypothetical protein [Paenibacillus sp. ClWae2A]MDT9717459.1 hypothetical protein [Paenibacillus sp. ClWae2A]